MLLRRSRGSGFGAGPAGGDVAAPGAEDGGIPEGFTTGGGAPRVRPEPLGIAPIPSPEPE